MKKYLFAIAVLITFTACQNKQDNVYVENTLYKTQKTENTETISTNTSELKKEIKEYKVEFDDSKAKAKKVVQTPNVKLSSSQKKRNRATEENMKKALLEFYKEWKHVKYRFGGNSKRGIDCSAFTQRIFKEKFGKYIPRTTRSQVKSGRHVKKSQLALGDLIFFKTGRTDRHVGVYMGDGTFMHASIKGIKYTKVNKPFYVRTYWTSRRIID